MNEYPKCDKCNAENCPNNKTCIKCGELMRVSITLPKSSVIDEDEADDDIKRIVAKLREQGIAPIRATTQQGQEITCYMIDKDGLWWGTKK